MFRTVWRHHQDSKADLLAPDQWLVKCMRHHHRWHTRVFTNFTNKNVSLPHALHYSNFLLALPTIVIANFGLSSPLLSPFLSKA